VTVKELLFNLNNFKDHERSRESMLLFGYGDGGGGPTLGMLERLARVRDVDGLPRVEMRSPSEFFARCEADLHDPLVWVGELYFELHRGTYTSQARNKKFNRSCEFLLHDVEFMAALAHALHGTAYPSAELEKLWKLVLLNQFHDILPGSSIGEVYRDSSQDYTYVAEHAGQLRSEALAALSPEPGAQQTVLVFNTLSFARTEVAELPRGSQGTQISADGSALGIVSAPSLGYAIQAAGDAAEAVTLTEQAGQYALENAALRAVFTPAGELLSLLHRSSGRESIAPGEAGNRFVLYEDDPNNWDAWDVDAFHLEKPLPLAGARSVRVLERGPLRASLEFTYEISPVSSLQLVVSLSALSLCLAFACKADWHEQHKFLKVEFALNLRAMEASYEIQFGHLKRPTHFNTSWDMARFEVPAHKWADLSEPGFGVALLNDCKYGHAAHANVLRLSLLRAPSYPDENADQGKHHFRYALLPHKGDLQEGGVVQQAHAFNVPLLVQRASAAPIERSYFDVSSPGVVIDTVKKSEDSDALIVRLYEAHGSRSKVRLSSSLPIRSAWLTDLLENEIGPLVWTEGGADFEIKPFEIVTLKLAT
jgi:alpha-mannosidase